MIQSVNALAVHGWMLASDVISKMLHHDVGPQRDAAGCIGIGVTTGSTAPVLHKHNQAGVSGDKPTAAELTELPACVTLTGEGFFESDLWTFVLALSAAGAALTFIMAILIGVKRMLGGQGAGVGQAVKAVMPLLLFAAMFSMIATLPTVVLPAIGKFIQIIFSTLDKML